MPPKLKKINNNVFYSGKQLLDLTKGTGSEINKEKLKVADRGGILVPIIIDRKEHEAKTLDGNFYGVTKGAGKKGAGQFDCTRGRTIGMKGNKGPIGVSFKHVLLMGEDNVCVK